MSRTRSFSFPRLDRSKFSDEATMAALDSSYHFTPSHSRESSGGSTTSSPITSTFSARSHSRWPSSTSSLVTNPDSPATTAPTPKSTLGDLVEHPSEREESSFESLRDQSDEPLCICDSPFCEHRQYGAQTELPSPLEWTPGDDYFSDSELPGERMSKRRRSGQISTESFTSRLSRHFPSFSRRHQGHRASASVSSTNLRSAPPSRTSSLRLSGIRSITAPATNDFRHTIIAQPLAPAPTPIALTEQSISPPRARTSSRTTSRPADIDIPLQGEESEEDKEQLASTPLLPPMLAEYFNNSNEAVQSPLQSPTIAAPSTAASVINTPAGTPVLPGFQTPPLSARASLASLRNARSGAAANQSEIPSLAIAEEIDPWAIRLGHANFHITPEPYIPDVCDAQTCKRLADDWEAARVEYMRLAARTSEHYGPTSHTYKLTQQKWAEIDNKWRANHEKANAEAQASGESPFFQPLAETEQMAKMPSLNDPEQPSKFPEIEEKDIVGPMVRYAKIQQERKQSKKPSFLKLFTDPASLLGGRSSLSSRR